MNDKQYMAKAIQLAKLASGHTSPNPLVGAVVVKDGCIIGEGWHHKAGTPHAEVHALTMAGSVAKGATLYVTLEPCAHYGKTPPCADLVVNSGISHVVIGSTDPNPLVAGKGISTIERAGITVTNGVLEEECLHLNEHFFTYIQKKRPFITLKSAMSLDGKIATKTGKSQWITNEFARRDGHVLRATHNAMLVGIGTILADDPSLNCRINKGEFYSTIIDSTLLEPIIDELPSVHQPDVIILDSQGRTPITAKVFKQQNRTVHIFVGPNCSTHRVEQLKQKAIVHKVPTQDGYLPLKSILSTLGALNYTSILVEGGAAVMSSFVEEQLFDKIITYIGNILIGGAEAISALTGSGISELQDAPQLEYKDVEIIGNNIKFEAYLIGREGYLCSQESLKK